MTECASHSNGGVKAQSRGLSPAEGVSLTFNQSCPHTTHENKAQRPPLTLPSPPALGLRFHWSSKTRSSIKVCRQRIKKWLKSTDKNVPWKQGRKEVPRSVVGVVCKCYWDKYCRRRKLIDQYYRWLTFSNLHNSVSSLSSLFSWLSLMKTCGVVDRKSVKLVNLNIFRIIDINKWTWRLKIGNNCKNTPKDEISNNDEFHSVSK